MRVITYDPPMKRELGSASNVHATIQHEGVDESVHVIELIDHLSDIAGMFDTDPLPNTWAFWIAVGYSVVPPAKLALTPDQARCMANLLIRAADIADELKAKQK